MALTGAMSAGISGMKAQMSALNVVGNNVANVNTPGYKPGRVTFRESIYSTEAAGSNGNTVSGGTNPRQTGYGCNIATIDLDMSSQSLDATGMSSDAAIQGDGFFLVGGKDGVVLGSEDSLYLSRVGDFDIDANGYLVDGMGNIVYGFVTCNVTDPNADPLEKADAAGINGNAISTQLVPIRLPLEAQGTEQDLGNVKAGDAIFPGVGDNGENTLGAYEGYSPITYKDLSIGKDGKITCTNYKTGDPITIGYVALATVTNPGGLTHVGYSYYKAMEGCGEMSINAPGGSLAGKYLNNGKDVNGDDMEGAQYMLGEGGSDLMPGFLEASGTDLATEFTNMIVYQRGYQANTRIVTVTDTMLEELVNMKR